MSTDPQNLIRFEGYEVDRARWQLRRGDEILPLNRKTFDLLLVLIDHADRVVGKEELLTALWPRSFVEESNLTQQVSLLRKALSRHPSRTRIIETTPGRGYRFVAPLEFPSQTALNTQFTEAVAADPGSLEPLLPLEPERSHAVVESAAPAEDDSLRAAHRAAPYRGDGSDEPGKSQRLLDVNGVQQGTRWSPWATAATILAVALGLFLMLRSRTPARVTVSAYTQITHDGHAKSLGGTDGRRIYFTRPEASEVRQISIAGGPEAPLRLGVQDPWTGDVSPDGSTLLVVSEAAGQGPADVLWSYHLVGGTLRRLGNALTSAWSPDGKKIAAASANGDLFVMEHDGSDAHRIASPGGYIQSMAWSPDGKMLRFSKDGVLWQIAPDGRDPHPLLPGWGKAPTQLSGGWGADTYFFVADGQLWALEDGSLTRKAPAPTQLTFGPTAWDRPVPTPDGKTLFASGQTKRGELVRFDASSGQFRPFLAGISAEFVTFAKRGGAMAYVSYPDGVLWRANSDGSNPMQLTDPPLYPKSVCWSPDASQIAFVSRTADNIDAISVMATDGTGRPHRLLPLDREAETDPSWSPDGTRIAFSTSKSVGATAKSDLRIFDTRTGTATVIPGSDGLQVPRWSPDGRAILAMTLDTVGLKLFHLSDASWHPLNTGAVAFPEWSHDGSSIYYVRWTANPAILRIHPTDGRIETMADLKGTQYTGVYTLWMGLDPEDNPMMLRDEGTDDIYALALERK